MKKNTANWHRADVIAALKKRGWSVASLSRAHGLASTTLRGALGREDYPKGERIIADALGMKPEEIWPERFEKRNFQPQLRKSVEVRL